MSPAKKPRKALNDALAAEFVYGEPQAELQPEPEEAAIESVPVHPTQVEKRESLMSRLMDTPEKEATVRITVDLPKSMHQKLSMLSARTGRKKAEIVRMLLDEAFNEVEQ